MADPFLYGTGERSPYGCLGHEVQIEHINAYVCRPSFFTDKAVIVIHDIFGWLFPDIRYIVDLIAGHGYITICPDFFKGTDPWKTTDHWADFAGWMKDHDPMKVDKEADVVLKYLKEQCGAKKIGIIRDSEERYNLLNPTFFIFGEKDHTISYNQITLLEEKLKQYCKVAYKIKVYPGQVHGFAQLKPEDMKPDDKPYIEEARKDMIDWLKMFI
ncbi:carboxymethylenebutenolidase homolog isoform X2 [Aquila chrysaetos chrysaetos]|uniref:carboxymethylenebutenolidase homolog isoform X2 n=1 Tax=Aquila chrysaetos chrysaetos TaxID=223781 RepID=UPI001176C171|nr:carboxymethylenebutenolidase homolog isoform X2 [Aquila chrysaetos chrysaetos]